MVRTDVDSARSNIITATFVFGVDIVLDSVLDCSNVQFQLKYNNSQYIKFNGYKDGDFKKTGTSIVYLPAPFEDPLSDETTLNIGVLSGLERGENEFDNPRVLHLEFVVLQNAPVNTVVSFTFPKAEAISASSTNPLRLRSQRVDYRIHSFVSVWPGDANNDGIVATEDYSAIGLYMRKGADEKETRTFKRLNASTQWYAQRVLLWDIANATYADCDGDGAVTVVDGLIVKLNDSKVTNKANIKGNELGSLKEYNNMSYQQNANTILYPIRIYNLKSEVAFHAKVNMSNIPSGLEFKGIAKGDVLSSIPTNILGDLNGSELEFLVAPNNQLSQNGVIAYLCFEGNDSNINLPYSIVGYDENRHERNLRLISFLDDAKESKIVESKSNLKLLNLAGSKVYNIAGLPVILIESDLHYLNKLELNSGVYFIVSENLQTTYKFVVEN